MKLSRVLLTFLLMGSAAIAHQIINPDALRANQTWQANGSGAPGHSHGSGDASSPSDHSHKTLAIPPGQPVPSVKLVVQPDAMRGWNLEAIVKNFTFAPNRVNTKSLTTEGHAHLYINGKKVTRLYGPWYYISNLPPGQNKITVTLNANGHEELTHNGQVIQNTVIVTVPNQSK